MVRDEALTILEIYVLHIEKLKKTPLCEYVQQMIIRMVHTYRNDVYVSAYVSAIPEISISENLVVLYYYSNSFLGH